MNSITIAGNISSDAEIRSLPNGDLVSNFSLADNMGKDKGAIFWRCQLFGKRAESLSVWLKKGASVTVSGEVTEREYTDKEGNKRKSMEIRVGNVALQGGRKEESAPRPQSQPQRTAPARNQGSGFEDFTDAPF